MYIKKISYLKFFYFSKLSKNNKGKKEIDEKIKEEVAVARCKRIKKTWREEETEDINVNLVSIKIIILK